MFDYWFISRQKRQLTQILPALITFNDVCVGKKWSGNHELQIQYEDELGKREITKHGKLRARKSGNGGGGVRTLFKQMNDLGLIFEEDENKHCQLTLIGEELIKGKISFVKAMRLQLQKYQYPSATCWSGSGSVSHDIKVHPFQFMMRLLMDDRLEHQLTMDDMKYIVIHYAVSDSSKCYEQVVRCIIDWRNKKVLPRAIDDSKKTFANIANTFFNYLSLTQYIDRGNSKIFVRRGKEEDIKQFIQQDPKFISHPELLENYQRAYGRGFSAKDLRDFSNVKTLSKTEIAESRIRNEYALLALKTPITGITEDVVQHIVSQTGIDEKFVEKFLMKNYPSGNIDDFFLYYKELAHGSRDTATEFETATCEMFRKIFKMQTKHVGQIGNTPDVYVESDSMHYCGIIDNKAYKVGYSISGDHKRRMEDEYIPHVKEYGSGKYPLAFFSYISGSFGRDIDEQIESIHQDTGVDGSAMPVDILIDFAQDYTSAGYTHGDIKNIFSVNREVRLNDISKCGNG
ncbi:MAG: AlwI family type II restriction endonuclease [Erysipelotrichaceae bacterium]|nr:AlwI family type II restriction endonuclease [Erysipelotrichaceae bacterium]